MLGDGWRGIEVAADGASIRLQPGVIGAAANRRLAPLGRKIGPDPASIDAAMIGGIVANNSSGMCCGVAQNSYHTLESAVVPRGRRGASTPRDAGRRRATRAASGPSCTTALLRAARRDRARDATLAARIRNKFARKNTTAYSLNAFLDHDAPGRDPRPPDGRVAGDARLPGRDDAAHRPRAAARATALLLFDELEDAGRAVAPLAAAGAAALEIMDAASLRSRPDERGMPRSRSRRPHGARCSSSSARRTPRRCAVRSTRRRRARRLPPARAAALHDRRAERDRALAPAQGPVPVGRERCGRSGTAVVIEDVVFPGRAPGRGDRSTCSALFDRHGFRTRSSSATRRRQPALRLRAGLRRPRRRSRATRALHARAVRPGGGEVRRRAQGRARLRPQHGAVRRATSGASAPTA